MDSVAKTVRVPNTLQTQLLCVRDPIQKRCRHMKVFLLRISRGQGWSKRPIYVTNQQGDPCVDWCRTVDQLKVQRCKLCEIGWVLDSLLRIGFREDRLVFNRTNQIELGVRDASFVRLFLVCRKNEGVLQFLSSSRSTDVDKMAEHRSVLLCLHI